MPTYRRLDGTTTHDPEEAADSYKQCADVLLAIFPPSYKLVDYKSLLVFEDGQGGRIELVPALARVMAENVRTLIQAAAATSPQS